MLVALDLSFVIFRLCDDIILSYLLQLGLSSCDFQINELEAESDKSGDEQESKQLSVEYNQEGGESNPTDSPNLLEKINSFMR